MTTLIQYDRARAALAEATRVDEILPIRDQMAHLKLHARHVQDRELMADATEIQIRAERKLGELLIEAEKVGLLRTGRPKKPSENPTELEGFTLKEIGVSHKLSAESQKKASISEQAVEAMIANVRGRIIAGRAKIIDGGPVNGARSVMSSRQELDDSLDYSPTPPYGTRALIERVLPSLGVTSISNAWEPACGEGHIAEVLMEYGTTVIASDIYDYGYGEVADFLAENPYPEMPQADFIITNPPFKEKAEQFALRALDRARVGVAIFARLQWLETIGRYERLFRDQPPTLIAFFCERINLCMGRWDPEGGTATAYIWLVWIKGKAPQAPFWIPPGCRKELSRADDVERFTAHPVTKRHRPVDSAGEPIISDPTTGEVIEPDHEQSPQVMALPDSHHSAILNSNTNPDAHPPGIGEPAVTGDSPCAVAAGSVIQSDDADDLRTFAGGRFWRGGEVART